MSLVCLLLTTLLLPLLLNCGIDATHTNAKSHARHDLQECDRKRDGKYFGGYNCESHLCTQHTDCVYLVRLLLLRSKSNGKIECLQNIVDEQVRERAQLQCVYKRDIA